LWRQAVALDQTSANTAVPSRIKHTRIRRNDIIPQNGPNVLDSIRFAPHTYLNHANEGLILRRLRFRYNHTLEKRVIRFNGSLRSVRSFTVAISTGVFLLGFRATCIDLSLSQILLHSPTKLLLQLPSSNFERQIIYTLDLFGTRSPV
jgi:hypothetical protein